MSLQAAVDRLEQVVLSGNSLWVTAQQINNATTDANVHQPAGSYLPSTDLISHEPLLISRLVTGLNEILDISDHLSKPSECSNLNVTVVPSKMSTKPVAPPTVLSINHLRVVYTSIELLWILGISGVVAPTLGCTFDWNEAIHPKSLLISKETVSHLCRLITAKIEPCSALQYTKCIYSIISNSLFSANMLPRNLKRVLVALLVLSRPVSTVNAVKTVMLYVGVHRNNPVESASSTNKSAESLLHDICLNDINKSLVVSELRIAIKGPLWMRTAASDLLSKILLSDMGLAAVIRAYLEGMSLDKLYAMIFKDDLILMLKKNTELQMNF